MPVLCLTQESQYREIAERIASDRDDEVVTTVEAAGDGTVRYVAPPDDVDLPTVIALQQRLLNRGPTSGAFGVLTGFDPAATERLYEREPGGTDRHLIGVQYVEGEIGPADDDATLASKSDTTPELLRETADEAVASLSLMSSGWPIHTRLTDGFVCGIPESRDVREFDRPLPFCVADDGSPDCPLVDEDELVRADDVRADQVFWNSCTKLVTGQTQPYEANPGGDFPVHVGMSLLENARSVIGTYRELYFEPAPETLLHYCLLRAGYDASERCYVLNRRSHALGIKSLPYVTFGQPHASVSEPTSRRFDVSFERREPGVVECRISPVETHVVDFRLPAAWLGDTDRFYVERHGEQPSPTPLYYVAFREDDDVRVLCYSSKRLSTDELRVEVRAESTDAGRRRAITDALDNTRRLRELGLLDGKGRTQLADALNRAYQFTHPLRRARHDADVHRDVTAETAELSKALDALRDRLLDQLPTFQPLFSDRYVSNVVPSESRLTDRRCEKCGQRLFVEETTQPLGRARRIQAICPKCITVFDVPAFDDVDVTYPRIESSLSFDGAPESAPIDVTFANPRSVPMRIALRPHLASYSKELRERSYFDSERVERTVEPSETEHITLTADLSSLSTFHHQFEVYVVGNMSVYLGAKYLNINQAEI